MLCRLIPVCLSLALWGCNVSAPPPGDTAATSAVASSRTAAPGASPAIASESADRNAEADRQRADAQSSAGATDVAATGIREGAPGADAADAAPKQPPVASVEAAMTKFRRARTPKARQRAAADLEKALAEEPDHVEGLLQMVKALQLLIEDADDEDEPTEALHHKTVVFLDKALEADPALLKIRGFKPFAADVYFEDARALAREKKPAESLALLDKAVQYGYPLEELDREDDLDAVRKLPEFATLIAAARERIRQEVAQLLEENKPFDFDFDLKDVTGKRLSKTDMKGKVLIVDFWGTWCKPCRLEIPHFMALDREYREKGLQIVGLNCNEGEDAEDAAQRVKDFCEEQGVRYPCALASDQVTDQVPDLEGFPTTLFFDRTGKLRLKVVAYHDLFFLRAAVETLLNETVAEADRKPADRKGD